MPWLDRSDTACQPCANFTPQDEGFGTTPHECFAGRHAGQDVTCLGRVYFCTNCNSDHHSGGWNTCAAVVPCRWTHPACDARWAARNAETESRR